MEVAEGTWAGLARERSVLELGHSPEACLHGMVGWVDIYWISHRVCNSPNI